MKINKVRFKNINSLRGEHVVDFTSEPLKSAGLFAITGPTGSGKTTLLDVICLALFSRVPRIAKPITKSVVADTGAILTRNTQECYAEVEYECKKGVFRSKWEISTARTGNLRDYDMFVSELPNDKIIDAKKSEVPGINEGNIGLHFDQFVKSMLLAQGEFAKFLQSDKKERSALLEKITGTNIYRELGKRAFEKYKEHGQALDDLRKEQSVYREQLLDDETLQRLHVEHETLQKALKEYEGKLTDLGKKKDLLEESQKLKTELAKLSAQKEKIAEEKAAFDKLEGHKMERHKALMPLADELNQWRLAKTKSQELQEELSEIQKSVDATKRAKSETSESVRTLVGELFQEDDISASLSQFHQKAKKLTDEMLELRSQFREKMAALSPLKKYGLAFDPSQLEASVAAFKEQETSTTAEVHDLSKRLNDTYLQAPHEQLGVLEDKVESLKVAVPLQSRKEEKDHRLAELSEQIQAEKAQLEKLPSAIDKARQTMDNQEKLIENLGLKLENQKLKAELETHRQHLKNGEPCPLCGALEHPFAEGVDEADENALERELQNQKRKYKELQKALAELEASKKQAQLNLQNAQKHFEAEQQVLQGIVRDLSERLQHFTDPEINEGLAELKKRLSREREVLQDFINQQEKQKALKDAHDDVAALQFAYAEGMRKKEAFTALYPKPEKALETEVQALRDSWSRLTQQLQSQEEHLQKAQKALQKEQSSLQALSQKLLDQLKPMGYSQIASALEHRLSETNYNQLVSQQHDLLQRIKLNEQATQKTQQQLAEKQALTNDLNLETLVETIASQQREKQERAEQFAAIDRKLVNHKEDAEKVARLQTQITKAEKEGKQWVLLNQYIGDATGNKFNQFAQDLTLSQLIVLANHRLASLNDRYLLDKAKDHEDDSLMVVDQHMGNERRSVKTLSGGETFLMSLSLALALSDLASRNVEINSLFIDEGFGTLDPEILDQTLDTLEKLQSEGGKTIGIISHVEALKERINTQIRLVRNGQGYSSLKVQG